MQSENDAKKSINIENQSMAAKKRPRKAKKMTATGVSRTMKAQSAAATAAAKRNNQQ